MRDSSSAGTEMEEKAVEHCLACLKSQKLAVSPLTFGLIRARISCRLARRMAKLPKTCQETSWVVIPTALHVASTVAKINDLRCTCPKFLRSHSSSRPMKTSRNLGSLRGFWAHECFSRAWMELVASQHSSSLTARRGSQVTSWRCRLVSAKFRSAPPSLWRPSRVLPLQILLRKAPCRLLERIGYHSSVMVASWERAPSESSSRTGIEVRL
mmetsp:Transcript_89046/g.157736  ORF Transcript_89046/g.157736 Transcript_89046/m.157736 type:complete len:212 (-) Transcript_89046:603-1238(-)